MRFQLKTTGLGLAALLLVGCATKAPGGIDVPGASASALPHTAITDCPVTRPNAGALPPAPIDHSGNPPVWYVKHWYGNSALWVMLPDNGVLPAGTSSGGGLSTKFPWWRIQSGGLQITAVRLDGGTNGFSATAGTVDQYGDQGFDPSQLTWSSPGCWRVTGTVGGGGSLTITMRVENLPGA